jgi:hypothetical protein
MPGPAAKLNDAQLEAFWSLVLKSAAADGHWIWKGQVREDTGAPYFRNGKASHANAARIAWDLGADTPLGLGAIRVACGEKLCIRPDHQRPGRLPRESKKTRRARMPKFGDDASFAGELLRLHRRNDEHNAAHAKAVAHISEVLDAMAKAESAWRERIEAKLAAIGAELRRLGALGSTAPVPCKSPYPVPAEKPPTSLAGAFEHALGLRDGAVIDPSPLDKALRIAVNLAHGNTHQGAMLFSSWLDAYKTAGLTPTPTAFLAHVRERFTP